MTPQETAKLMAILDRDEFALAVHTHISGLPLVTAARALGWTVLRVDRTRKRLQRKLDQFSRTLAPPTRRMVDDVPGFSFPDYLERLPSGRRLWSMRHLPASYLDVIQEGILIVELPNQLIANETSRTSHGRATNMKSTDHLRKELSTERTLLDRLGEQTHAAYIAAHEADRKLGEAQRALKNEKSNSPAVNHFQAAVARAQTDLAARQSDLAASRTESTAQAMKNAALEDQLRIKEFGADIVLFEPSTKDFYDAVEMLKRAAGGVSQTLAQRGGSIDLSAILTPTNNKLVDGFFPDLEKNEHISALQMIYNGAQILRRSRVNYDPAKERSA